MVAKLIDQQKICGNLPRLSREPWMKELKARKIWENFYSELESWERKEKIPLDDIYDDLTAYLKNLESLSVNTEMADVFLYPLVESSLPLDIIQVWQRNPAVDYGIKEEGAESGDKSDAGGLSFLQDEVKGAERLAFAKENFEGNCSMRATGSQPMTPRKTPPTVSNLFGSAFKRKCIFCQRDNHLSSKCFVASRLTLSERDQKIKEARVCFKCIKEIAFHNLRPIRFPPLIIHKQMVKWKEETWIGEYSNCSSTCSFAMRTTPHGSTGVTPAQLLMCRRLTTRMDRLHSEKNSDEASEEENSPNKFKSPD
ncbi:hypothetical protein LAZ67_2003352 [Cordylochernes scorpioides]|uniref:Uncharacterized protein n=1 Tax=Cordylochernes scorpioides TaxID=51811 RepID=A0ABY6K3M2_9ARAC|nr:hypothetical protein LAZ67_2003352 [Cordylochernes scorpioides]